MKRKITRFVSGIAPTIFVNFAFRKLTSPQVYKLRPHEAEVLDQAEKSIFLFQESEIQIYEWKAGPQKVLLIHGWEGQAGNFADLIDRFLAQNISVVAFDGPAHGKSSAPKNGTSLFNFADLVGVMIERYSIKKLVSHSFGGVATTYALAQIPHFQIDKYVLFTTPNRFLDRIEDVAKFVGFHDKVKEKLKKRIESRFNLVLTDLDVEKFVQTANVKEALILHDTFDKVLSVEESREVAKMWKAAKLIEVTETGHYRILRTATVLDKAIAFLDFK
jgi:pimeloyl-ACP methyl ester carboxylesterase